MSFGLSAYIGQIFMGSIPTASGRGFLNGIIGHSNLSTRMSTSLFQLKRLHYLLIKENDWSAL
jgi:hypothetical protein